MMNKEIFQEPNHGKIDNFYGDRSIVMPQKELESILKNPIINDLFITDIGFYPHAKNHFRNREKGIKEHILIYCIDGHGYIKVKGQITKLQKGCYFIIQNGLAHSYWASKSAPWSIYWLHFGGKKSNHFSAYFNQEKKIQPSKDSRIDFRIQLFKEALTILESGFTKENIEYTNLWLHSLLATFFYVNSFRAAKGFQGKDPVEQAIFYMQEKTSEILKISNIANEVNLSESHFSKLFRNKTGSSPMEYFINLKMQEAIRLLSNKSMRIKEVAYQLGYNDPFYFSRIFRKYTGFTPFSFLQVSKKPK